MSEEAYDLTGQRVDDDAVRLLSALKERDEWRARAERAEARFKALEEYAAGIKAAYAMKGEACDLFIKERDALRAELAGAQARVQELTGLKFSDRMWHALKSRAEVAERELAAVRGGAWVACSERMPPDHGIFLCYWPTVELDGGQHQGCITTAFYDNDDRDFRGSYHGPATVTHWRPLPTPPASAGDGREGVSWDAGQARAHEDSEVRRPPHVPYSTDPAAIFASARFSLSFAFASPSRFISASTSGSWPV